jgi:hypothetical protein
MADPAFWSQEGARLARPLVAKNLATARDWQGGGKVV